MIMEKLMLILVGRFSLIESNFYIYTYLNFNTGIS